MIVNYNFNCCWNSQKKERITHLLSERILLITGIRIFEKISNISFYEREWIKEKLSENSYVVSGDRLAAVQIIEASCVRTYELVLEKDILLFMLSDGAGQSHFDNLVSEFKSIIQIK